MASEHTGGWRTIDSAPRRLGEKLDLWCEFVDRGAQRADSYWDREYWRDRNNLRIFSPVRVTHWMPSPDPPAALALTAGET